MSSLSNAKLRKKDREVQRIISSNERRKAFSKENLASTLLTNYVPMIIAFLLIALPLVWMAFSSFKPVSEIVTLDPSLLPQALTVDNYVQVADRVPLGRVFRNSLIFTAVGIAVNLSLDITSAYAISSLEFHIRYQI